MKDNKNYIILFNKPMDVSKAIYTHDDTTIRDKVYKIFLHTEHNNTITYPETFNKLIGTCKLKKDITGVYAENIETNLNITKLKLRPASKVRHKHMDDKSYVNNEIIAQLEYTYINIDGNIDQWIRDNKLNTILNT